MKKLLVILLAMTLLFAGCAPAAEQTSTEPSASPEQTAEATTRTITDMLGREVEIPSTVNTVATIGATARMLTYAGCADKITGLTDLEKSCYVGMPYAYINSDSFANLTSVAPGGPTSEIYDEALATLNPDIIFAGFSDIEAVNTMQSKLNIPIVALSYTGIFDNTVYEALTLIGDIMGTQDRCAELVSSMKGWQKDLNDRTKDIPEEDKPTVYVGTVNFAGTHGIEGTYANYPPFVAINAKNVVDETGEDGTLLIDKEQLVVWDPDIIFLTPANMSLVTDDYKTNPSLYNNLKAVKDGNVYSQSGYNYYGCNIGIAIVDAYYAGTVIYPEQFSDVDIAVKADEIFTEIIGQPYFQILLDSGDTFDKIIIGD